MPLELITIPCLDDNYAFVIANPDTKEAALIDVPDAAPINATLARTDYRLTTVLLTHHHWDHIDGLPDLDGHEALTIIGAQADKHRLPALDIAVVEGDIVTLCGEEAHVLDVSGHTIGHIAIHLPASKLAFTADSLMAMGCGRLFEGTPDQMWGSMLKLRRLPDDTQVCSGHEYTTSNAEFALDLEPDNPDIISRMSDIAATRAAGNPTVPSLLGLEKQTNPFLRADDPALMAAIGMTGDDPKSVFAEIRGRKDRF